MPIEYGETRMASSPNQSTLRFGIGKFLALAFLILYVAPLSAQKIEIRLVDGRNGRPMTGKASYLNVWVGTERKKSNRHTN